MNNEFKREPCADGEDCPYCMMELEGEYGHRRTCRNVGYYIDHTRFKCSECGYNGWVKWAKDAEDRVPCYCPNCGAKVVE